jgi:hypothetical protein
MVTNDNARRLQQRYIAIRVRKLYKYGVQKRRKKFTRFINEPDPFPCFNVNNFSSSFKTSLWSVNLALNFALNPAQMIVGLNSKFFFLKNILAP